ncbi:unnamed protein product [Linum tenue]|uniref:Dirigent protein n=4 Tax=Linum tenue TaxID=586396 RepID=A0AAV0IYM4_9ROSI|nr:unnamed protein product [Linum tenue]
MTITTISSSPLTTKAAAITNPVHHHHNHDDYVISSREDHGPFGGKRQQLTHLRFYWQNDASSSPNATDVMVVQPVSNSSAFGCVSMMDDPLTVGPSLGSALVGRAQGFYACASRKAFGLLMAMNLVLLRGKYNGSSVTVLGRNEVPLKVRELPVVGGTGVFRMATGYALLTTSFFDPTAGIAVVEYNVYIWHY